MNATTYRTSYQRLLAEQAAGQRVSPTRMHQARVLAEREERVAHAAKSPAERYAEGLQKAYDASRYAHLGDRFYAQKPGRKYTRIVEATTTQVLVHAFVDNATGEVYKAAGWTGPAKGARYPNVEAALAAMGDRVNTGYLYR